MPAKEKKLDGTVLSKLTKSALALGSEVFGVVIRPSSNRKFSTKPLGEVKFSATLRSTASAPVGIEIVPLK